MTLFTCLYVYISRLHRLWRKNMIRMFVWAISSISFHLIPWDICRQALWLHGVGCTTRTRFFCLLFFAKIGSNPSKSDAHFALRTTEHPLDTPGIFPAYYSGICGAIRQTTRVRRLHTKQNNENRALCLSSNHRMLNPTSCDLSMSALHPVTSKPFFS